MTAWIKRRIEYSSPDTFSLWTGVNEGVSFTDKQLKNHGKIPTLMFDDINENSSHSTGANSMRSKIFSSVKAGMTNGIYQGHGATEFLDNYKFLHAVNNTEMTEPGCYVWATCDAGRFFFTGYDQDYEGSYSPIAYHYMAGKKAIDKDGIKEVSSNVGNNITTAGDHTKGAVNIIAASSLAGASWEANFVNKMVHKMTLDENATWGEVYQYAKKFTTYDQNSKVYHFLGDPSVKVRGTNPRSAQLGANSAYKNSIPLTLKGDWENKAPKPYLDELKISYTAAESGELSPVDITSLTDEQKAELINGGTELNIDISSISELSNITIEVYTKIDPEDSGGVLNSEQLLWSKHKFNIDRTGPQNPTILRPTRTESLGNSGVGIIDSTIFCQGETAGDNYSSIAGYQFILRNTSNNKTFESNSTDSLLTKPEFTFITQNYPEMIYGEYELTFVAFDSLGNSSSSSKTIYWRKSSSSYPSFDVDTDNDSLSDVWGRTILWQY